MAFRNKRSGYQPNDNKSAVPASLKCSQAAIVIVAMMFGGCRVPHGGLQPVERLRLDASPSTLCPGDSTQLSWEALSIPRSSDYCDLPAAQVCVVSSECPTGSNCLDQRCVVPGSDLQEIDFGMGCPIDGELQIEGVAVDGSATEQWVVVPTD